MRGPRLLAAIALAVVALSVAVMLAEHTASAVVRWTGRSSLVLFSIAYVARPAHQLWRAPLTKWLLAERKWFGLGFATSHFVHLIFIVVVASADFGAFLRAQPPTNAIAAVTFLLIFAMAFTSIEAVKRRMSPKRWKLLHRTGMHFAWISFAGTYTAAAAGDLVFVVPAVLVWGIAAIRIAAWVRQRRRATNHTLARAA